MEEGGKEGAGKAKREGGELRGSPASAHAPAWRAAPGRGSRGSYEGPGSGPAGRDWGARGVAGWFGAGGAASSPLTAGARLPRALLRERPAERGAWAGGAESGVASPLGLQPGPGS